VTSANGTDGGVTATGTGSVSLTWTVLSSSTTDECTSHNAQNISITLTATSSTAVSQSVTVACDAFSATIANVEPGSYTLAATLVDGTGADLTTEVGPIALTVTADATTPEAVDFPDVSFTSSPGGDGTTGNIEVDFTIASGTDPTACTTYDATTLVVNVEDSNGTTVGTSTMADCTAFMATVTDLAPGTYTVTASFVDASGNSVSTTVTAPPVTVTAAATAMTSVDFPADSFMGATGSSGSIEVDWTIAGGTDPGACTTYSAATLMITVTDSTGNPVGNGYTAPCSDFATTVQDLPPGTYMVSASFVDSSGDSVSTTSGPSSVVVTAGATTAQPFAFPADAFTAPAASDGTLAVTWTVASTTTPAECTTYDAASISLTFTDSTGAVYGTAYTAPCSQFATTVSLPAGTYNVSAQMVDASGAAVGTAIPPQPITITADISTPQAFDFPASSFN
jgi:uncharacterized protein (DUF2141 family)